MKSGSTGRLSAHGLQFCAAAGLSLGLAQVSIVWVSVCGASTASLAFLFAGVGAGLWLAAFVFQRARRIAAGTFATGIAALLLSWTLSGSLDRSLSTGVPIALACHLAVNFAFLCPASIAAMLTGVLATWFLTIRPESRSEVGVSNWGGLIAGCLWPLVHAATVIPLFASVTVVVAIATVIKFIAADRRPSGSFALPEVSQFPKGMNWSTVTSIFGLAMFAHAGTRMVGYLMPLNFTLLLGAAAISMLLIGSLTTSRGRKLLRTRFAFVGAAGLLVSVPWMFGPLIGINLKWNATTDSVTLLMAFRSLQLAAIWCLVLVTFHLVNSKPHEQFGEWNLNTASVACLAVAASVSVAAWGFPVVVQLAAGACLLLLPTFSVRSIRPAVAALAVCGVAAVGVTVTIDTGATSYSLFSARAAQGIRSGLTLDQLQQVECTRLIDQSETPAGQLTVWKTSAEMLELRRDGIPIGQLSANTLTTPQPIAESLTTILPLVMHSNANSVLLLGDETGVGMRICCNSPLHTIHAIRTDQSTTDIAEKHVWRTLNVPPAKDERVSIQHRTVATAIRQDRHPSDRFDVVVASSPNPVTLAAQEQMTTEFYAQIKATLNDDGVFCQRVSQHDLGAQPVLRIVSALEDAFKRVVVMQMAPGELAMVAGVFEESLLDRRLLDRLQRSHITRELGRSGWDWSQVAALPIVDTNDPVGIFEHQDRLPAVSASSGHFAVNLPCEAARWGNKASELQATFGPHQQQLAEAVPRGYAYAEYARRFSAVVQQMEILTTFHDRPWTYRNSLKVEMQRNPRPPIEKMRNGKVKRVADPRDEHRKNYFVRLGNVLRQLPDGFADPIALQELTAYTATYEPLLSFFAHHELIRIHEAAAHPGPALELRHRLHTVYFTEGRDFSVRQIAKAIQQILKDPELLASDEIRFDHVNSLLQELTRRWDGRRGLNPHSARQTQFDVDLCIRVANEGLAALEKWSDAVGMTRDQFLARRKFIGSALVVPLKDYREQVLAHRIKTEEPIIETDGFDMPLLLNADDLLTN